MIEEYFVEIEGIIKEFPNVRFVSLTKKIYNISLVSQQAIALNDVKQMLGL